EDEQGELWVEPAREEDFPQLLEILRHWVIHIFAAEQGIGAFDDYAVDAFCEWAVALMRSPDAHIGVVRDRDGQALGYSLAVKVCQPTIPLLLASPVWGPLLSAYWPGDQLATLPANAEASPYYYLIGHAYRETQAAAVQAWLMRDLFGLLARG